MTPTQFRRLGATAKRKAIIRDALKQIEVRKFRPVNMTYVTPIDPRPLSHTDDYCPILNRESLTGKKAPACEVCATGAMFLSAVRKGNWFDSSDVNPEDVLDTLTSYFTVPQILMVECAFELRFTPPLSNEVNNYAEWPDEYERDAAVAFGKRYRSATGRLRAILKNMLKNKGIFTP